MGNRAMDREMAFNLITNEMCNLFLKKNKDYGNSFDKSLDEDGLLVSKIRLGDKYNRFSSLIKWKKEVEVKDESIRDTLIDMANYAIMTIMWLDDQVEVKAIQEAKEITLRKGYNVEAVDAAIHDLQQTYSSSNQDHINKISSKLFAEACRVSTDEVCKRPTMSGADLDGDTCYCEMVPGPHVHVRADEFNKRGNYDGI